MERSVAIVGSGLGGLECGLILARRGFRVTVLERDAQIGGCLGTFVRGGRRFDCGMHYVGGLGEGEPLHRLFADFGLMDLGWEQLDPECVDEVVIGDRSFAVPSGHDRFIEGLSRQFPSSHEEIVRYADFLQSVNDNIFSAFGSSGGQSAQDAAGQGINGLFSRSAYDFLNGTVSDPLLRKVLSGTSLKMELRPESLPLYVFAQINASFMQSAWRLRDGGSALAGRLASQIEGLGGSVRTRAEVRSLVERDGRIACVRLADGEELAADWVISDIHPAATLGLIADSQVLRKIYRRRVCGLENTGGIFTANIRLHPGSVKYLNRNIFVHVGDADLWHPSYSRTESVMVHFYPSDTGFATHIDLLSPMPYADVEAWRDAPVHRRGADYEAVKARKAEECVALASRRLPELRDAIERIDTSSPLTWESYTGTPQGSAYGIRKDWRSPLTTVLSPRTPIPNLLLTGQSLNLHGLLGVSMTSVLTCRCIG